MNLQRIRTMLGFAMRAGKLTLGTELICKAMQRQKNEIKLVIISSEASEGTKKKLGFKTEFYKIPALTLDISMSVLGQALGKSYAPAAVAVCDEGFAKQILEAVNTNTH